jgi:hypothetical protein
VPVGLIRDHEQNLLARDFFFPVRRGTESFQDPPSNRNRCPVPPQADFLVPRGDTDAESLADHFEVSLGGTEYADPVAAERNLNGDFQARRSPGLPSARLDLESRLRPLLNHR